MIEVYPKLFVGDEHDYESMVRGQEGWAVVHACKEPYHRLVLGYGTRGAPKGHHEYLVAQRDNRLMLNIVDAPNPAFFAKEMIDAALDFVDESLEQNLKLLVHCNEGASRGPSIALLYMAARLRALPTDSLEAAEEEFKRIYPGYAPKAGIRGHLKQFWVAYCAEGSATG